MLRDDLEAWCAATPGANKDPHGAPEIQMTAHIGAIFCGAQAYPGFTNLASICYLTSVVQCLLHCADSRKALLDLTTPGDVPAQGNATEEFCRALRNVARKLFHGEDLGEGVTAFFDVYSPTELIDSFCLAAWPHQLGSYFDAAETLQYICRWTGLAETLFDAKSAVQCEGILSRAVEAKHLAPESLSADLGAALADAFASEPHSLLCAPKLLALSLIHI